VALSKKSAEEGGLVSGGNLGKLAGAGAGVELAELSFSLQLADSFANHLLTHLVKLGL
jgi:hypothetical protein